MPAPYSDPPLRIAYVGNFRHPWCTERHVAASLESLGHDVTRWQEDECDWVALPGAMGQLGIQVLFWTRTWPAEMAVVEPVLKELAAEGIPTVSYHLDRWFGLDRQHQVDDQPFFRTSLVVSPDDSPQWAEHGVNHFWLPPGVYGPECEPVPPNPRRWPWDVVFVGCHPYPHPEWQKYRTDLLSAFRAAFGRRFAILPRERRGTPIRGRDLQELYATVPVVLGDSCLAGESHRYWSDRVPETLGRGGLLIHPRVDGMTSWYYGEMDTAEDAGGEEYTVHPDFLSYELGRFGEAVELAKWALAEPTTAGAIRAVGRFTVLARDTYAHRMGTVLAVAEGIYGGYRDVSQTVEIGDYRPAFSPLFRSGVEAVDRYFSEAMDEHARRTEERLLSELKGDPPPSLRVKLNRWSAVFEPRPGTTDEEVCHEVWRNDYRIPPHGFKGGTVLDVGGNIGAFAVLAIKAGAGQVVTVEPDPDNRERLKHHLVLNGVNEQVTVLACAVSGRADGVGRMVGEGGGARWVFDDHAGEIPCTTLENLIGQFGPFEFYKQDAEGAEFAIFDAVPVESLAQVDRLSLEWHGPDGPPGHPGAPHLAHLTGEEFGPLVTKLADAGEVLTFGHPRRGGLIHWKRYGA